MNFGHKIFVTKKHHRKNFKEKEKNHKKEKKFRWISSHIHKNDL